MYENISNREIYLNMLNNYKCEMMKLTKREYEVLLYICQGYTSAQIAEKLIITVHTVEAHSASILYKMNAKTRAQAVYMAFMLDLIDKDFSLLDFNRK